MIEIVLSLANAQIIPEGLQSLVYLLAIVALAVGGALARKMRRWPRLGWSLVVLLLVTQIGFYTLVQKPFRHDAFADFERVSLAYPYWNCADASDYRPGGRFFNQFVIEDFRRLQERPECKFGVDATEWVFLALSFIQTLALCFCLWMALILARTEEEWSQIESSLKGGMRLVRLVLGGVGTDRSSSRSTTTTSALENESLAPPDTIRPPVVEGIAKAQKRRMPAKSKVATSPETSDKTNQPEG